MLHKTADKRELAKRISEHLRDHPEVRPFPTTVTRLINALQDANATATDFEAIIAQDPALAGKLLRLTNSPLFSPNGRIESIATAVSLLGLRRLRSIAMSVAGDTMFSSGSSAEQARIRLWEHSVACACVGRSLAKVISGTDADEMFLAGIFHDVGKLLFFDVMPELYEDMTRDKHGRALVEEERYLTGFTHEEIGFKSSKAWELPVAIQAAICWHSCPQDANMAEPFVRAFSLANELTNCWGISAEPIDMSEELTAEIESYGLSESQLERIAAEARDAFQAARA